MVNDLVINAALFIASFFIIGQLFRKYPSHHKSDKIIRFLAGVSYGFQGILLMIYTIHIDASSIMDLRHISIMIASLHGGLLGAIVSSLMIALVRLSLFGISFMSVTAAACMLLIGMGCGLLMRRVKPAKLKFPLLNLASLLLISTTMYTNMSYSAQDLSKLPTVLLFYWIAALLCGQLAYYLYLYISRMNRVFFKLQESEQRYRSLIEKSPDATIVHDSSTILFANDKALRLLNAASPKDVVKRSIHEFIHPRYQKEALRQIFERQFHITEGELMEQKYIRLDGVEVDVEVSISVIEYKEQPAYLTTVRDITERKLTEQKLQQAMAALKRLSDLDGLTGIANRRTFDAFLESSCRTASEKGQPISLIMFDADQFKAYNDTYGHQGGDDCLRALAEYTEHSLANTCHLAARYGGEEFAVILVNTEAEEASSIAEQLRRGIEAMAIPHRSSTISDRITVSLGTATAKPPTPIDPKELVRQADSALYRAKMEGRNRVAAYSDEEKKLAEG